GFLLLLFLGFYAFLRLFANIIGLFQRGVRWRFMHRLRYARRLTDEGICNLLAGYPEQAEKKLVKSAKKIKQPVVNYLTAAMAANDLKSDVRRDQYLELANASAPFYGLAVKMTQAKLQVCRQQWDQASITLEGVLRTHKKHLPAIKCLAQVYHQQERWQLL